MHPKTKHQEPHGHFFRDILGLISGGLLQKVSTTATS